MAIEDQLLSMKRKVADAKSAVDRATGAVEQLNAQLKREHGVTSLSEAEALLTDLEKEEQDLDGQLREVVKELEEKYEW